MLFRLVFAFAVLFAAGAAHAQNLPALYAEGGGASGFYAVGLEQTVLRSADDARRLTVRAGAGYWTESEGLLEGSPEVYQASILRAPVGATASFALGTPLGVPLRFETTGGIVIDYTRSERRRALTGSSIQGIGSPLFGEVVLRAEPGRYATVRAGFAAGGRSEDVYVPVSPVLGVGVRL